MYEHFRDVLVENISKQFSSHIFLDYQWDQLPSSYPCHGSCMENHLSERSKRDISPSDPAVLYLPLGDSALQILQIVKTYILGGGGSKGCPSLAESAVVGLFQSFQLFLLNDGF